MKIGPTPDLWKKPGGNRPIYSKLVDGKMADCALVIDQVHEKMMIFDTDLHAMGLNPERKDEYDGWLTEKAPIPYKNKILRLDQVRLDVLLRIQPSSATVPDIADNSADLDLDPKVIKHDEQPFALVHEPIHEIAIVIPKELRKDPRFKCRVIGRTMKDKFWFHYSPGLKGVILSTKPEAYMNLLQGWHP